MDAGRFAAVLGALWAAHDLGDHVVQTDHQAATKASSWRGMAGHVGGYTVTQCVALGALHAAGVRLRPGSALGGLALSAATHAFLDRRWPVVELLRRTGSGRFASGRIDLEIEVMDNGLPSFTHRRRPEDSQRITHARGPLPIHGPYLADQSLHHVCVALAAALVAR